MSIIAAMVELPETDDWRLAGGALILGYLVLYPLYVFYQRNRNARRIRNSTVTSKYKQPLSLGPVEISYVFNPKVATPQLYATLLDLANRSIIQLHKKHGIVIAEMGPKVDKKLKSFEKFLVGQIHSSKRKIPVDQLMNGSSKYKTSDGQIINGSKQYVFWWLLRNSLQREKIINKHMTGRYIRILFTFGVVGSLLVSVLVPMLYDLIKMLIDGEVELDVLGDSFVVGLQVWVIALIPVIIASFFLLRFRGRMLGREWLLTNHMTRYLGQAISFKEYVRLTNNKSLNFESKELEKEASVEIRPNAIAFGYIKE